MTYRSILSNRFPTMSCPLRASLPSLIKRHLAREVSSQRLCYINASTALALLFQLNFERSLYNLCAVYCDPHQSKKTRIFNSEMIIT